MAQTIFTSFAQSYIWRDSKQQTARTTVNLNPTSTSAQQQADGGILAVDLGAVSDSGWVTLSDGTGHLIRSKGPFETIAQPWQPATAASYTTVADKARLFFTDTANKVHAVTIVCPKPAIFLADNRTVDFTNGDVAQLCADILAQDILGATHTTANPCTGPGGSVLKAVVAGSRISTKTPRKFNIFTRNPTLTGQGL